MAAQAQASLGRSASQSNPSPVCRGSLCTVGKPALSTLQKAKGSGKGGKRGEKGSERAVEGRGLVVPMVLSGERQPIGRSKTLPGVHLSR
ncbi:hypothetical protein cyc_00574 [Cyclospora cayetanensis]|uniref:Uncharacterized protein n=1 Tax=Cyclospora cayetanensis TaxID=88456 RepID=A0A1D3CYS2_9EIME|nr:hypothetical protein cyc_00574 [Cyclospora cayetanensis]